MTKQKMSLEEFVATRRWFDTSLPVDRWIAANMGDEDGQRCGYVYAEGPVIEWQGKPQLPDGAPAKVGWHLHLGNHEFMSCDLSSLEPQLHRWFLSEVGGREEERYSVWKVVEAFERMFREHLFDSHGHEAAGILARSRNENSDGGFAPAHDHCDADDLLAEAWRACGYSSEFLLEALTGSVSGLEADLATKAWDDAKEAIGKALFTWNHATLHTWLVTEGPGVDTALRFIEEICLATSNGPVEDGDIELVEQGYMRAAQHIVSARGRIGAAIEAGGRTAEEGADFLSDNWSGEQP